MAKPSPLVIAGSNRSGTTWLQHIVTKQFGYRVLYEPLHPRVSGTRAYVRLYLDRNDAHPELYSYVCRVVQGHITNRWMLQGGRSSRLFFYRNRWWVKPVAMKLIRGNLMLEWLVKNFTCRIIYIIRHPCAAVSRSRLHEKPHFYSIPDLALVHGKQSPLGSIAGPRLDILFL